ncbi:MAG TPA: Gfo/Idh/MocA family oxidoreductase [Saprospiraceae bacterium]|nr:Gfo/Idh/MocA family oxidoreductase [Saprospiraceae bacterium]
MENKINWGIIGPGRIAHKFAKDLAKLPDAKLFAVASRSLDRAQEFARQYEAPHAFGSYEEIVNCEGLDVVYIATPHTGHYENTLLCLRHQIAVLCEKPMAVNPRQVQAMILEAREQDTFLMEAIWTRFIPTHRKMWELIEQGAIGEVLSVKADFGFKPNYNPDSRLFNKDLAGGALLDIGIYPVFLAMNVLGKPDDIHAFAHLGETGVDEEVGILFKYDSGQMAHLHSTIRSETKSEAFIYGEKGTIYLHSRWHEPSSMSLLLPGEAPRYFNFEYDVIGYSYEAAEVMACLQAGKKESEALPLSFSEDLMEVLFSIRHQVGLKYPEDK